MNRAIAVSASGIDFIKQFEAVGGVPELSAYKKPGDPITIGFGHTGPIRDPETGKLRDLKLGDTITAEYAHDLLVEDIQEAERRVDKFFAGRPLTQGQRDALVSFCFNLSLDSIISSTLRKMLLSGDNISLEKLTEWWIKYRNPRTIFEEGLFRRRVGELCLWYGWPTRAAWSAELRRDRNNEISFMSNPQLILYRAEAEASNAGQSPEPTPTQAETVTLERFPEMPEASIELPSEPLPEPVIATPTDPVVIVDRRKPEAKPIEDSVRVEGYTREREGERWLGAIGKIFPMGLGGTVFTALGQVAWWEVLALACGALVIVAVAAELRRRHGKKMKEHGRAIGTQDLK